MTMSRKHFEAIAAEFKAINYHHKGTEWDDGYRVALQGAANRMADLFARENPRFDRDRFLSACGYVWKVRADDVEAGMVLDFNTPASSNPEDFHTVESVEGGFWGDGSFCVEIVFKDTNDGQSYSYEPNEEFVRIK